TLPYLAAIEPDKAFDGFTLFMAGGQDSLGQFQAAFRKQPEYWVRVAAAAPLTPEKTSNGFAEVSSEERERRLRMTDEDRRKDGDWMRFGLATVVPPREPLRVAEDDWPFLYLRSPMIPARPTLSGMAVMAVLALLLLWAFAPAGEGDGPRLAFDPRMFF